MLHDQVDVVHIVVSLVICHDVGMVHSMQNLHFVHDSSNILFAHFLLVDDFDSPLLLWIFPVDCQVYLTVRACAQPLFVDYILLLKLLDPCFDFDLSRPLATSCSLRQSLCATSFCLRLRTVTWRFGIHAPHFNVFFIP